jgi:hypothetical protein
LPTSYRRTSWIGRRLLRMSQQRRAPRDCRGGMQGRSQRSSI